MIQPPLRPPTVPASPDTGTGNSADNPLSPSFWRRPPAERHRVFAQLRALDAPAFLQRPTPGDWHVVDGFYALTRYEDVAEAGRHSHAFSSEPTVLSLDSAMPQMHQENAAIINVDDPRHAHLRKIVARAFTPRRLRQLQTDIAAMAHRIVDELLDRGPCDFAEHVAAPLPLELICTMTGIPANARNQALDAVNALQQSNDLDSRFDPSELASKLAAFDALIAELVQDRRTHPADDLISALVTAAPGEDTLKEAEVGSFFLTLVGGGNETVRNALSEALILLTDYPTQRRLLLDDLDTHLPTAVEEIVRHASPGCWARRNVTQPVQLRGHTLHPGDKVILYYASANMDETVFTDPAAFDIQRTPNPHLGFGAFGPHYCIGAHLARSELTILLKELLTRVPAIHATGPPTRQSRGVIQDITHLACALK